jgi:hypothetical protein
MGSRCSGKRAEAPPGDRHPTRNMRPRGRHSRSTKRRMTAELRDMKTSDGRVASMLIDKRLASAGEVGTYAELARSTGRKFVLFEVDAPLEASLAGVLERAPGGVDPLPPFNIVADGFRSIHSDRGAVIEMFMGPPGVRRLPTVRHAATDTKRQPNQ